jgi:hypothetical protein
MNLTSLITLPARLGYEAARKALDVAFGAGRMIGLFGDGASDSQPAAEAPATPQKAARKASERRAPTAKAADRPKPARPRSTRAKPAPKAKTTRSAKRASEPRKRAGGAKPASEPRKRPVGAEPATGPPEPPAAAAEPASVEPAEPASLGSRVPGAVEADEVTLIRKVKDEVLRDLDAAELAVDVNPIGGVVRLSGRATGSEQVRELQRRALSVPGVKRVENELLAPDAPAPGPFHAERHVEDAEPLPTELADRGEGRQPAPLGAGDDAPGGGGDPRSTIP